MRLAMLMVALLPCHAAPAPRPLTTLEIRVDSRDSKDLRLDTRIRSADRQKYRSIRDAKDWENPRA